MESSKPIITPEKIEHNFLNFNLTFNAINYNCNFVDINTEKIKITINSSDDFNKYEKIISFKDFRNLNKYFKMFDTLKELENDLEGLNNSQKIQISNVLDSNLNLCINVLTLDNNKVIISLNKCELSEKDKINKILKENEEIKKELSIKSAKIDSLEKEIQFLKSEILNIHKTINEKFKQNENYNCNDTNKLTDFKSDIFLNENEKNFVLNNISKHIKSIKLQFSSKINSNNIDTLKKAYLNKPNLIFCIKTKKGRRFGGYSNETFLENKFRKYDINAFLFSLDNKKIIKSRNTEFDIWNNNNDSIQFGGGTDLRIYYDFSSNKNYTSQSSTTDYNYNYEGCQDYVLNGEEKFSAEIFEIFQIFFS